MSEGCIFCRIVSGAISATRLGETEEAVAFRDIAPQAPTHVVVIPKTHYDSVLDIPDGQVVGHLVDLARRIARDLGCDATGYRLVINAGSEGGQTVPHLHLHLLAGRPLRWPPG